MNNMNLKEIREYLDKIRSPPCGAINRYDCKLYTELGRKCSTCPFTFEGGHCKLQEIINSLDNIIKRDCPEPDTGVVNILRRIEQLERDFKCYVYQTDHQRIGELEHQIGNLEKKVKEDEPAVRDLYKRVFTLEKKTENLEGHTHESKKPNYLG